MDYFITYGYIFIIPWTCFENHSILFYWHQISINVSSSFFITWISNNDFFLITQQFMKIDQTLFKLHEFLCKNVRSTFVITWAFSNLWITPLPQGGLWTYHLSNLCNIHLTESCSNLISWSTPSSHNDVKCMKQQGLSGNQPSTKSAKQGI